MAFFNLPKGVVNLVTCSRNESELFLTDPRIQAVTFVGSTDIGKHIYSVAAAHGKRVQAQCEAKNHALVREALRKAHRFDLIGYGPECLVPPERGSGNGRSAGSRHTQGANSEARSSGRRTSNTARVQGANSRSSNSRNPNSRSSGPRNSDSRNSGSSRSGKGVKTGSPTHSKKQRRKK